MAHTPSEKARPCAERGQDGVFQYPITNKKGEKFTVVIGPTDAKVECGRD